MNWTELLVGAVVGAIVGYALNTVIISPAKHLLRQRSQAKSYRQINAAWRRVSSRISPSLELAYSVWGATGFFAENTIRIELLREPFQLTDERLKAFREVHAPEWLAGKMTDGEQIGIAEIAPVRTSDDASDVIEGRANELLISAHRYNYFDFLATHRLLVKGTPEEKAILTGLVSPHPGPA